MTLIDRITPDEKDMITHLRAEAYSDEGSFVQGSFINTDDWLYYWNYEKEFLMKPFENGLILKKRVKIALEDDELFSKMNDFSLSYNFRHLTDEIYNKIDKYNSRNFIIKDSNDMSYYLTAYLDNFLFNTSALVNNKYTGENFEIKIGDNKVYKITSGSKVMKIIGKLARAFDLSKEFEELRIEHSQILNDANIESTLCISIHPLDYMTASYNNNNWRSCMNWLDGEYRRGVVEMMNSSNVIVAYLESDHEHIVIDGCKWNSKRWREFFIVDEFFISGIKGYPFWNKGIESYVLEWLYQLYTPYFEEAGITFSSKKFEYYPESNYEINDPEMNIENVRFAFECGPAMYNDFYGAENVYNCYYSSKLVDFKDKFVTIDYSGPSECVCCGKTNVDFDAEGDLCCNNCIEHHSCCICGDSIIDDYDLYTLNGLEYCERCFNNLPYCSCCESPVDVENTCDCMEFGAFVTDPDAKSKVFPSEDNALGHMRKTYWTESEEFCPEIHTVCPNCINTVFKSGDWKQETFYNWNFNRFIPYHRLTKKGQDIFDKDNLEAAIKASQKLA